MKVLSFLIVPYFLLCNISVYAIDSSKAPAEIVDHFVDNENLPKTHKKYVVKVGRTINDVEGLFRSEIDMSDSSSVKGDLHHRAFLTLCIIRARYCPEDIAEINKLIFYHEDRWLKLTNWLYYLFGVRWSVS